MPDMPSPSGSIGGEGRVRIVKDKTGTYHCTTSSNTSNSFATTTSAVTINPETVRQEVNLLKTDVNMRARQVMFNTLIGAYYATFVPCCFVQSALHYEVWWVFKHGVLGKPKLIRTRRKVS